MRPHTAGAGIQVGAQSLLCDRKATASTTVTCSAHGACWWWACLLPPVSSLVGNTTEDLELVGQQRRWSSNSFRPLLPVPDWPSPQAVWGSIQQTLNSSILLRRVAQQLRLRSPPPKLPW